MRRSARSRALGTLAVLLALSGCPAGEGFVDPWWLLERKLRFLRFSTSAPLSTGSVLHAVASMERERSDAGFAVPAAAVPPGAWDPVFAKLFALRDTSDFDVNSLLLALHAFRGHPMVSEALWQDAEQALLSFKYWYTDPTPARVIDGEPLIDDMFYWTENHTLLFHVNEYLAGQLLPDRVFEVTGLTGAEHQARAHPRILDWMARRARLGFLEWHSNVYYPLDMAPLLLLVEFAEDEELATRAAMLLDLLFLDVALHLHQGTFGATHGRSYIKDKRSALTENTFNGSKLLFDDTRYGYQSLAPRDATYLAVARKYRLPEVIRRIARHDGAMVDRERMNLPVDEKPPEDSSEPPPPAPEGFDWTDERHLPYWWAAGAWSAWQVLPLTFEVADRENLWVTSLFRPFVPLRDLVYVPGDPAATNRAAREWLKLLWKRVSLALLEEVDTYTWRTGHTMLSTAQDYRKGVRGTETHSWQATLDEKAIVFTNHPAYLPIDTDWARRDEPGPGYWTGEASQPRSAQHENVAIHIYAPQYEGWWGDVFEPFRFLLETHAYFPTAHFDEVAREAGWTFGRRGDGYVALWSYRPTEWREGGPEVFENAGLPFDLVATGAPENVWIVECGDAGQWGSFEAFQSALVASPITVTPLGRHAPFQISRGFDVAYQSPSQGAMTFGWTAPLVVRGVEVPIHGYRRLDNPFAQVEFAASRYVIEDGGWRLELDFEAGTREASGPPGDPTRQVAEALERLRALLNPGGGAPP